MNYEYLKSHPSYKYAIDVIDNKIIAGKYIKIVCQQFLDELNNENSKYFLDEKEIKKITDLSKLIIMPTGIKVGISAYKALANFQWFFLINALCWKHKDNPLKRRYEKSVLLIARKSGKSFICGFIFIILLLTEPKYSEFYSVAPDRELSSIVKKETEKIISSSPLIEKYFKILKSEIKCKLTNSIFQPLATSDNRMDGRQANVFVADEVGALRNSGPIESMMSSQMNMINRTGILISTAYENPRNPMVEEIKYSEKVLNKVIEDETVFALLYQPDDPKDWTSDKTLFEANPLAIDIKENYDFLVQKRNRALELPSARKNFLTKHLNIFVDGDESEIYVPIEEVVKCKINSFDWSNKEVYLGVDLSQTNDNTAISMVYYDVLTDIFYVKVWGFIPTDRALQKSKVEHIDYYIMKENGYCYYCGDKVISYSFVEDFVLNLEKKYKVIIKGIGYDRYNCISSANKWYEAGYNTIEIKQHSSVLYPATKLLKESILENKFRYEKNQLFEINFSNCKEVKDTNLNTFISKKKSTGKVDLVIATINAICLWEKDIENGLKSKYDDNELVIF